MKKKRSFLMDLATMVSAVFAAPLGPTEVEEEMEDPPRMDSEKEVDNMMSLVMKKVKDIVVIMKDIFLLLLRLVMVEALHLMMLGMGMGIS
jgi:hypothetical protein